MPLGWFHGKTVAKCGLTQHSYQRGDSKTNCAYLANCMLTQQNNVAKITTLNCAYLASCGLTQHQVFNLIT